MPEITVTICTGTTCYVMGAGQLLQLKEQLSEEFGSAVELVGSNCLGYCKDNKYGDAPYARVNDTVITGATVAGIIAEVRRQKR